MTAHSLDEISAVLGTGGKETSQTKKNNKSSALVTVLPPNYCVVCGERIQFYYPYGFWEDPNQPGNLHAGTCSSRCEDIKDPVSAAFRAMRAADRIS